MGIERTSTNKFARVPWSDKTDPDREMLHRGGSWPLACVPWCIGHPRPGWATPGRATMAQHQVISQGKPQPDGPLDTRWCGLTLTHVTWPTRRGVRDHLGGIWEILGTHSMVIMVPEVHLVTVTTNLHARLRACFEYDPATARESALTALLPFST